MKAGCTSLFYNERHDNFKRYRSASNFSVSVPFDREIYRIGDRLAIKQQLNNWLLEERTSVSIQNGKDYLTIFERYLKSKSAFHFRRKD